MDQGLIPRRYAKALFLLAAEKGCDAAVYDAMRRLAHAFSSDPALDRAMGNPAIDVADKMSLILTAAAPDAAAVPLLNDFVRLLDKNRRLPLVREMALAYVAEFRRAHRIFSVAITSAGNLLPDEMQRIQSLVKKHLPDDATAEFARTVNPDLIGGFTVSIDNELLDASVANELKQLRLKLLSH